MLDEQMIEMAQDATAANAELSTDGLGFQDTMDRVIEGHIAFSARAAEMFVKGIDILQEMFSEIGDRSDRIDD